VSHTLMKLSTLARELRKRLDSERISDMSSDPEVNVGMLAETIRGFKRISAWNIWNGI